MRDGCVAGQVRRTSFGAPAGFGRERGALFRVVDPVLKQAVAISLPVLLPMTFILWPADAAEVAWPSWAGLLYLALISQYFGFWLWNSALALGGVARIGQVQLLQTFATLAIAAILLGEAIDLRMILFATAVMVIVALGLRARVGSRAAAEVVIAAAEPKRS